MLEQFVLPLGDRGNACWERCEKNKSEPKATLVNYLTDDCSQNGLKNCLLCYGNRCFQTKRTGSWCLLCLPFSRAECTPLNLPTNFAKEFQPAAMKITAWLPGTSVGNQLKLSCFPYSLLIMQMEALKQRAPSYHTSHKLRRPMWCTQMPPLHPKPCRRIGPHGSQPQGTLDCLHCALINSQAELEGYRPWANHLDKLAVRK